MTRTVAIGAGCRSGCAAPSIEALVREALRLVPDATPAGLFTIADKAFEAGLVEAARQLGFALVPVPRAAMRAQSGRAVTSSPASQRRFGVPSVAEAAALAGAGPGSVLLVRRLARDGATCAIAGAAEFA